MEVNLPFAHFFQNQKSALGSSGGQKVKLERSLQLCDHNIQLRDSSMEMGRKVSRVDNASGKDYCQSARFLLFVAFWFGLLTGMVEVAILAVRRLLGEQVFLVSQDVVWMAPLADVIFFLLSMAFLLLVSLIWRGINRARLTIFLCVFFACLNMLLMLPRLHHYAALLLAAGLAVHITRFIRWRWTTFYLLTRHTGIWMLGLVIILTGGVQGWKISAEWQALANLPPAPLNAPNVLLIVLDTVRAQNLSLYGYSRSTTPHLERLAKTGVVFTWALTTAPWTLPSHASMFTGRFPHELSSNWERPLDTRFLTLAEFLSAHGYLTAGFVANTRYCSYEHGLNRGFTHYEDYRISLGQITASSTLVRTIANHPKLRWILRNDELLNRQSGHLITHDFLRWLFHSGHRSKHRPFFAFLNYFDAHTPYLPPSPFNRKFGRGRAYGKVSPLHRLWATQGQLAPQELQEEIDAYDGAIAYLDHELSLLFAELEKQGVIENTLVIITSDHGEEFGEHGFFTHGVSLYLAEIHVPLIISFPLQVPTSRVVREPVTLRDLPATIVDLLNLEGDAPFPGRSLRRYWELSYNSDFGGSDILLSEVDFARNVAERYPIAKGDMKSLVIDRMHYIKNGDGHEELYNFQNDPEEQQDLNVSNTMRQELAWFRRSLELVLGHNQSSN